MTRVLFNMTIGQVRQYPELAGEKVYFETTLTVERQIFLLVHVTRGDNGNVLSAVFTYNL